MRFGRIVFIWVIIFLISYLICYGNGGQPVQFIGDILTSSGTTSTALFQFLLVFGLVFAVAIDALAGDDD